MTFPLLTFKIFGHITIRFLVYKIKLRGAYLWRPSSQCFLEFFLDCSPQNYIPASSGFSFSSPSPLSFSFVTLLFWDLVFLLNLEFCFSNSLSFYISFTVLLPFTPPNFNPSFYFQKKLSSCLYSKEIYN